jgi:hypothetical protein
MTLVKGRGDGATQYSVICPMHHDEVSTARNSFTAANRRLQTHTETAARATPLIFALFDLDLSDPPSHNNANCDFFLERRTAGEIFARAITNAYRAHPDAATLCSETSQEAGSAH